MKRKTNLAKMLALAGLGLASSGTALQAQFTYNPRDLLLGFRQAGGASDLVVDIGQASLYYGASSSFTVGGFNLSQLNSAFGGNLNNVTFSVGGAVRTSGDVNFPIQTIWTTAPRVDVNTQSTPWQQKNQFTQGSTASQIDAVGVGAAGFSGANPGGPNNTATAVLIPDADGNSYHTKIGDNGDWAGTFQGNVENTTGNPFTGSARSDLYQLKPGTGDGAFLGYFDFNSNGTMTFTPFTPVPEPSTWIAAAGFGCLMLIAARRNKQRTI